MKASILITYYNQAKFVKKSLDSALSQKTDFPFEILVGDDGSSDNTQELVQDYIKRYPGKIRLFIMPRDNTVSYDPRVRSSANRLNLLEKSQGKYFCMLDGDDSYLHDSFLDIGIKIMEANSVLAACVFHHACVTTGQTARLFPYQKHPGIISMQEYLPWSYIHAGSMLFRKTPPGRKFDFVHKKHLFNDNNITFYYLNYGPFYHTALPGYAYNAHAEGIWSGCSVLEHHLINALGFNMARILLPAKAKRYAFIRYFKPIDYIYKHKNTIAEEIEAAKLRLYRARAQFYSEFIYNLLNWNSISPHTKRRCLTYYRLYKKRAQFECEQLQLPWPLP